MSLVYALYLTDQFFTKPDRDIIEKYLAPSYFENDFSALDDGLYIQKEFGAVKEGMYKLFKSVVIHLSFTWKS